MTNVETSSQGFEACGSEEIFESQVLNLGDVELRGLRGLNTPALGAAIRSVVENTILHSPEKAVQEQR